MSVEHPVVTIIGGTGKEGTGLATRWAAAGYRIIIGSRQAEKARMVADKINQQLGVNIVSGMTNQEAARKADICILTVIPAAHRDVLESVKDVLGARILIDATSRVDYLDPQPPSPPSAAEEAQAILGAKVSVVAAFQNIPAKSLRRDIGQPLDAEVLVCSDDIASAGQVMQLARAAGIKAYYAGPLMNANVVEGLTSILISLNKYYGIKEASIRVIGISTERQ